MDDIAALRPNNLDAFWMPYTANRAFKSTPRMLAGAKDMLYFTPDGREIIDGTAGLWCCNCGHGRPEIIEAICQHPISKASEIRRQANSASAARLVIDAGVQLAS